MSGRILVVDVGGSRTKLYLEGTDAERSFETGPRFGPADLVRALREATADWEHDRVALGCPGPVRAGRLVGEPVNLGPGWAGFDFAAALGRPVRLVNDALLQAIGAHRGGRMLFLGLGTGLGAALVAGNVALSLEFAHLPWPGGGTFEDRLGTRGLDRHGRDTWLADLAFTVDLFARATVADEVVLGGGNARLVATPPAGCRIGSPQDARAGGIRLWRDALQVP